MNTKELLTRKEHWKKTAADLLVGYTIIDVEYPPSSHFNHQPPCLVLQKHDAKHGESNIIVFPQSDEEGNDSGCLIVNDINKNKYHTLPKI